MRPDQERVRSVLIDSIVIMCQKGLNFNCELKLQGVIGITVDYEDSFVIHINQTIEAASNSNNSVNPSPSCSIKQEPQQSFGGFGESQSHPLGLGTPIKKEPQSHQQHQQQEYFPAPQRIKVESNQMTNQFASPKGSQQFGARMQGPPRANLQMALVPVNKNPPRMMRPAGRGMNPAMGGARMPRQPTARTPRPQFMQPTNVPPFPSFQSLNMGMQRPPTGAFPRPTRPKKAAQKKQKYVEQEYDEDSYDQFSQDEMSYSQPAKKPRGGATQGRGGSGGGGGAKRPRGGGANQFAGQVTPGTAGDRSFKLVSRFICDIDSCNASFTMKSNLRRHQKSKHPEYNFGDDDDDGGFDDEGAGEYY